MSIREISYGKNVILGGIKLKVDFQDEPFIKKFTAESNRSFGEILGYSICDVYDKNRKKILTILEKQKRRAFI
ncbi:MAG: hypothetical protein J6A15_06005 [Clostridia bacterium]|nr:hypothetical protein [Clostridia bacterium]